MLTPLDDSLWHQLPTTFDHVCTSDPRFFDRYWFAAYAPDGSGAIQVTMGVYSNMNVIDAGCCVIQDGQQYNLRASRSLRPRFESAVGPIRIEPGEALRAFRLVAGSEHHDIQLAVDWAASSPAREEAPHFRRQGGRVIEDYTRFSQLGTANGTIRIKDKTVRISRWWACRDHSWGVRPGMGVREPAGPKDSLSASGFAMTFLLCSTPRLAIQLHSSGRHGSAKYQTGTVDEADADRQTEISAAELDFSLYEGTRRFRSGRGQVALADGRKLQLELDVLGPSIAMRGIGYSGGFDDRKGLGVWRGPDHVEADAWDVSDPATIRYGDGTSDQHWHRIQPVRAAIRLDGADSTGTGSLTQILSGHLPEYGLGQDK